MVYTIRLMVDGFSLIAPEGPGPLLMIGDDEYSLHEETLESIRLIIKHTSEDGFPP